MRPERSKLTIVANVHANPDQIDLVKAELEELGVSRTLAGPHECPHLAAYAEATEGAVAEFILNEMSHIG